MRIMLKHALVDHASFRRTRMIDGRVVPIISDFITRDYIFGGVEKLASAWAGDVSYPWEDTNNLLEVARFVGHGADATQAKSDYLDFVKAYLLYLAGQNGVASREQIEDLKHRYQYLSLVSLAEELRYLSLHESASRVLQILATIPCRVFLTTSYHGFLEDALLKQGRHPHVYFPRWHTQLSSIPFQESNYEPTAFEPLVFHVFGVERYPASIVLTERDHMDFLRAVRSRRQGPSEDLEDLIPVAVRRAVYDYHLYLGYRVNDLDFNILDYALLDAEMHRGERGTFVAPLAPTEAEQRYLANYMRRKEINVVWQTPEGYLTEHALHQ